MKEILFLSKGEDASSTRYRALQFFSRFEQAGFSPRHLVIAGSAAAYLQALHAARHADIVVVQRKVFPTALLWLLRRSARRLVFDFDDAIFCNSDGTPSPTRMKRFAAMARSCDHILAGNAFLAATAARFNPAVSLIPTCIDAGKYLTRVDKPTATVDLVWIGSSSTRNYLEEALPALRLAASRVAALRLKIIADFDLPTAGIAILPVRWQAATEAAELASAHIGIAPMRNDDWSRGKCALKVLQYMGAGLPVVSSNAGVNAEVVHPGDNGFLVDSAEEWAQAIARLAADPALRQHLGMAGQRLVAERYSIDAVFNRIAAALASL
ncbi:glycosyltransferase family 4 protein [Thauera aromatica]|uniref:glycosyltransferase family 4 protein n=1 Tax=Thauera aromatica TaxID=59405 RepID=UPI001FFC36F3|nr:glycosyltransferase family 4 protein [Thauera aromatica]MCK2088238.1 glycosyltransferase family 4 protein [Thauera aromatica]